MNTRSFRTLRRGSVSAEYVLAASLAASVAMVGVAFPAAFGDLLFDASGNMEAPASAGNGGSGAGGAGYGSESGGGGGGDDFANPGSTGSGGGLGDDPWSGSGGDGSTDGSGGGDGGTDGSGGGDGSTDGSGGGDGSTDGSGGGTSSSGGGDGWGSDPWSGDDGDDGYESSDPWTRCNQGLGNGAENCDPGNSNNVQDSNDEPGSDGRGNDTVTYTLEDGSTYTVTRGRGGGRNR